MKKTKYLFFRIVKDNRASAMIENVVVLPLVFVAIFSVICTCFVIHDRSTIEAAAKRGAIYAAHCIADPNNKKLVGKNENGDLDIKKDKGFNFAELGDNIEPYRYLFGPDSSIADETKNYVYNIVKNTCIPWKPLEITKDKIQVDITSKIFYQEVTVKIEGKYPVPKVFKMIGQEEDYVYTATSKMTVNDPDEFLRNADLVVDTIAKVTEGTKIGKKIKKISEKIKGTGEKVTGFLSKMQKK
ncbi:MAG: pilus assembly protein [Clostridia bacterium]|nr:pilus assembly protein [Clostridia bacterium]